MTKKLTAKCPHCGKDINVASIMGKASARKRDTSSEAMKALRAKRTEKQRRSKRAA